MRFLFFMGMVLFSTSLFASPGLFYVIDINDATKKELMLDQLYFTESPPPVRGDSIFGISSNILTFFSKTIDLATDAPPSLCEDRACKIPSISLMDDSFKLYLPWLMTSDDVYVNNKKIQIKDEAPSIIHAGNASFISGLIGPEATSIYRLSNFFGLAAVADIAKHDTAPFRDCLDLLSRPYSCDNVTNGGFSTTGNVMLGYLKNCFSCSEADNAILKMISTHHLLRSSSALDKKAGISLFSKHDEVFQDVGINYGILKELYLKALTEK